MTSKQIILDKSGQITDTETITLPKFWNPIKNITFKVISQTPARLVLEDSRQNTIEYNIKGYIMYPFTDISNIKRNSSQIYKSPVYCAHDSGLMIDIIFSPDSTDVTLLQYGRDKKILNWLAGKLK